MHPYLCLFNTCTYINVCTLQRDGGWRARDDVDMERALRPGAPDVVRSTMNKTEPAKFSAETIDSILGTPGKICIPERYIPESAPVSPDERKKRMHKAEAIRKMLSESTPILTTGKYISIFLFCGLFKSE